MANNENVPEDIKNMLKQTPALSSLTGDNARFLWFSYGVQLVPEFLEKGTAPEEVANWIGHFIKQMEKIM